MALEISILGKQRSISQVGKKSYVSVWCRFCGHRIIKIPERWQKLIAQAWVGLHDGERGLMPFFFATEPRKLDVSFS